MIERRSVVAVFPLVTDGLRAGARGIRLPLPRLAALARPRSVAGGAAVGAAPGEVPWETADALRTLLLIGALAVGGGIALTLLRISLPVLFAVIEALHLAAPDTYDRLSGDMQPYARPLSGLVYGVILYGAVLVGLHKAALRPHGLRWSALYLRHASWSTYGKVAVCAASCASVEVSFAFWEASREPRSRVLAAATVGLVQERVFAAQRCIVP